MAKDKFVANPWLKKQNFLKSDQAQPLLRGEMPLNAIGRKLQSETPRDEANELPSPAGELCKEEPPGLARCVRKFGPPRTLEYYPRKLPKPVTAAMEDCFQYTEQILIRILPAGDQSLPEIIHRTLEAIHQILGQKAVGVLIHDRQQRLRQIAMRVALRWNWQVSSDHLKQLNEELPKTILGVNDPFSILNALAYIDRRGADFRLADLASCEDASGLVNRVLYNHLRRIMDARPQPASLDSDPTSPSSGREFEALIAKDQWENYTKDLSETDRQMVESVLLREKHLTDFVPKEPLESYRNRYLNVLKRFQAGRKKIREAAERDGCSIQQVPTLPSSQEHSSQPNSPPTQ